MYHPKGGAIDVWRAAIVAAAKGQVAPPDGPLSVNIEYYMPRPKAMKRDAPTEHIKRPDIDNLNKAVLDALTDAGVWKEDSRVYRLIAEKVYANSPDAFLVRPPGCRIRIDFM